MHIESSAAAKERGNTAMRKSNFHWLPVLFLLVLLIVFGFTCASAEEASAITNERFIEQYGFPESIRTHDTRFMADVDNLEVLDANFNLQSAAATNGGKTVAITGEYELTDHARPESRSASPSVK